MRLRRSRRSKNYASPAFGLVTSGERRCCPRTCIGSRYYISARSSRCHCRWCNIRSGRASSRKNHRNVTCVRPNHICHYLYY